MTATTGRTMSRETHPENQSAAPPIWQFRVEGQLGPEWSDWFGGLTVEAVEGGETLLRGPVVDQAALHGVLKRLRDLGIPLISLNRLEDYPAYPQADREEA